MRKKCLFLVMNLFLLVSLVFLVSCSKSTQQTVLPTATPTLYFVQLPTSVQSTSGWKITLSALDLQKTLGETESKNEMFLVGLVEIENLTGDFDCLKSDQFMLQNGLKRIQMERGQLEAGKSVYGRDYPGTIMGQCLDANEKQESVLVFDIPDTSEDLGLNFQEQTIRLGKIEAIRNPLPTLTPSATFAPTATEEPTLAPTATPTATFAPTMESSSVPTKAPTVANIGADLRNALKLNNFTRKPALDSVLDGEVYVNSNATITMVIYDSGFGMVMSVNASDEDMQQAWTVVGLTYPLSVLDTLSNELTEHAQTNDLYFDGYVDGYTYNVQPNTNLSAIIVVISPLP
jgi:hypothetical protein